MNDLFTEEFKKNHYGSDGDEGFDPEDRVDEYAMKLVRMIRRNQMYYVIEKEDHTCLQTFDECCSTCQILRMCVKLEDELIRKHGDEVREFFKTIRGHKK